jgi:hypothetical protein
MPFVSSLSFVRTPASGMENDKIKDPPPGVESNSVPFSVAPYRPGQGPPVSRRHSFTNQIQPRVAIPNNMNRPRGPPPTSPYGMVSMTPPGRPGIGYDTMGTPTSQRGMAKSPKGMTPLSPTRRGPPPRGPPPRGFQALLLVVEDRMEPVLIFGMECIHQQEGLDLLLL